MKKTKIPSSQSDQDYEIPFACRTLSWKAYQMTLPPVMQPWRRMTPVFTIETCVELIRVELLFWSVESREVAYQAGSGYTWQLTMFSPIFCGRSVLAWRPWTTMPQEQSRPVLMSSILSHLPDLLPQDRWRNGTDLRQTLTVYWTCMQGSHSTERLQNQAGGDKTGEICSRLVVWLKRVVWERWMSDKWWGEYRFGMPHMTMEEEMKKLTIRMCEITLFLYFNPPPISVGSFGIGQPITSGELIHSHTVPKRSHTPPAPNREEELSRSTSKPRSASPDDYQDDFTSVMSGSASVSASRHLTPHSQRSKGSAMSGCEAAATPPSSKVASSRLRWACTGRRKTKLVLHFWLWRLVENKASFAFLMVMTSTAIWEGGTAGYLLFWIPFQGTGETWWLKSWWRIRWHFRWHADPNKGQVCWLTSRLLWWPLSKLVRSGGLMNSCLISLPSQLLTFLASLAGSCWFLACAKIGNLPSWLLQ